MALASLTACAAPGTPSEPWPPVVDGIASSSSPIALSPDGDTVWVVNPDADSVTPLDSHTLTAGQPLATGREPWAVALTPAGTVVVMNRAGGSLTLLSDGVGFELEVGPELGGLALSPSGRLAFVSVAGAGELAVVDTLARSVVARVPVGRLPWSVAVTDDGDDDDFDETVIVAHREARARGPGAPWANDGKEAWLTRLSYGESAGRSAGRPPGTSASRASSLPGTFAGDPSLAIGPELVVEPYGFGFPNQVAGLAVAGGRLFATHLLNSPELPRTFDTTISAALSSFDLAPGSGGGLRLHLNDPDFSPPVNDPHAIALAGDASTAYLALAGTDAVMGIDLSAPGGPALLGFWPAGGNPRGIVLSDDGERAYVMNYLSRDVSVLDLTDVGARRELARVKVVAETSDAQLLRGQVLFNKASDPRLSQRGWISCASCHPAGGPDGTTWLTPDGPRQTQPLWSLAGTAPLHASATRDEVQDFEEDIETLMGGIGLAPGRYSRLLGEPNGGRSADLDALAAYVLHGVRVPAAAAPEDDLLVAEGRGLFGELGCAACHGGSGWTSSRLPAAVGSTAPGGELEVVGALVDVGTFDPAADVLGANGFDVPTLLGAQATAPYLHDGSAASLAEVLANVEHVGSLLRDDQAAALVAYLMSIDAATPAWPATAP